VSIKRRILPTWKFAVALMQPAAPAASPWSRKRSEAGKMASCGNSLRKPAVDSQLPELSLSPAMTGP
jgi:hypothetical protein